MIGLIDRATVYTETAATGAYTTVATAALSCRLAHVNTQPAATGASRAELAALRVMIWASDYFMPEQCQIEVAGVRWNPIPGSFGNFRGPSGAAVYRKCDVVRAA